MTARWTRIEPLLALVQKPARHARRTHQRIDHDGRRREVMTLDDDVRLASLGAETVVVPAGSVGA